MKLIKFAIVIILLVACQSSNEDNAPSTSKSKMEIEKEQIFEMYKSNPITLKEALEYQSTDLFSSRYQIANFLNYLYINEDIKYFDSLEILFDDYINNCEHYDQCGFQGISIYFALPNNDLAFARKQQKEFYSDLVIENPEKLKKIVSKLEILNIESIKNLPEDNYMSVFYALMTNIYGWSGDMEKAEKYQKLLIEWTEIFGNNGSQVENDFMN